MYSCLPKYPTGHSRQITVSSGSCIHAPLSGHGHRLQSYGVPVKAFP